jgi:hypothetical protein
MKEVELGELVIAHLKEKYPTWDLFQEIRPSKHPGSPIADIALINNQSEIWVIELKTTLNLDVIRQAYEWDVDYRSIAIPRPKRPSNTSGFWYSYVYRKMKLGVMQVNPQTGSVTEIHEPKQNYVGIDSYPKKAFIEILRSGAAEGFGKAGAKDGGHWTPYKETIQKVKGYVKNHPGCGSGDIVGALGKMHYASEHSARTNLVKNLVELEGEWCDSRRKGTYYTFYVKDE